MAHMNSGADAVTSAASHGAIMTGGDAPLTNEDLAPTPLEARRWMWWHYGTLWMGMVHNIFNFTWIGGLVLIGMSVWQALLIALVGSVIQTLIIGLNGRVGSRYGIPFPVWARSAFGTRGANLPALLRGAVAVGWFGVQSYLAALAVNLLLSTAIPPWSNLSHYSFLDASLNLWIAMLIYWALNFLVIRHGMETIRRFEVWAGPSIFVVVFIMLIWVVISAHGAGPLFGAKAKFSNTTFFEYEFIPSVAVFIAGSWATMCLNIPDLTRFAHSNRGQFWGTMLGLPLASMVYYAMAAVIVSGGEVLFHKTLWNPALVLTAINVPALSIFGAVVLALATMSVNVPANIVSPSYDLNNLLPRLFNFRRGASLAIVLAFIYGPWVIMKSPATLYSVLGNIGAILGPVTGIVIADYIVVRRRRLDVDALYQLNGIYRATSGFNFVGIGVLVGSAAILMVGEFVPAVGWLYDNAWFLGLGMGFVGYLAVVWLIRALHFRNEGTFAAVGSVGMEAIDFSTSPVPDL